MKQYRVTLVEYVVSLSREGAAAIAADILKGKLGDGKFKALVEDVDEQTGRAVPYGVEIECSAESTALDGPDGN